MLAFIVHVIEMWSTAVFVLSYFKVNLPLLTQSVLANVWGAL